MIRSRVDAAALPGVTRLADVVLLERTRSTAYSHAVSPVTSVVILAMMANVEAVEVVVAHDERATLRVGDVF